jgi:hypothetical protein
MKIVFSRKGFDSTAGGGASPIMPDGRMLSLPIPEPISKEGGARYADLMDVDGTSYLDLLRKLGYSNIANYCHLDPDLVPTVRQRNEEWRGMLGQADASATHLMNQGVGEGDLFLFWGLYANANGFTDFRRQKKQHSLFGYLEIGRVVDAGAGEKIAEAPYHPHFSTPYLGRPNYVFVATDRFSHDPTLPGWGVFRWTPRLRLTAPGSSGLTQWRLPECFHPSTGISLSHHLKPEMWTHPDGNGFVTVVRRGQGQEFVCDASDEVQGWAVRTVLHNATWCP